MKKVPDPKLRTRKVPDPKPRMRRVPRVLTGRFRSAAEDEEGEDKAGDEGSSHGAGPGSGLYQVGLGGD